MKKRFLSILLAVCTVLTILPTSVFAEETTIVASGECGAQGDNVTWTLNSEGVLIISGEGEMADFGPLYISMDLYAPWENNRSEIIATKIETGVTSIGTCAFYRCDTMCNIEIPDSMKRIGKDAFRDCTKLESVSIPDSVTSVEEHAFVNCTSLANVDISKNLSNIERGVFANCTSLQDIIIPSGVLFIGDSAFSGCSSLTNITIPPQVTTLGEGAFYNCTSLSSVTLNEGLVNIGNNAFLICSKISHINIPQTVTTIGDQAFGGCSMTSVIIPSKVTHMGNSVFSGCDELVNVVFEEGVTDISDDIFEHCDKLASVSIPSSVTTIGYAAFSHCPSLTSITIPSGVKNIDSIPFYFCTGLTEIIVDKNNTTYTTIDGVLYTKDLTTLVAYPIGNNKTTYTIPDGVTEIDYGAFIHCTNLTSMNMPVSVTTVGCDATSECYNLKDIYYAGTREQWEQIQFLDHPTGDHLTADVIRDATIHFADDINKTYSLTYSANGGSGTMNSVLVEEGERYTLPSCGFTAPADKEFKAWEINGEEYAPGSTYTFTADTTITAVWQTILSVGYTLTGTITGHKGVTYESLTARLVGLNGSTYSAEVGEGVTDKTGKTEYTYAVTAPAGQYTLEVEAKTNEGGVVNRTAIVKLSGNGQTKNINLPNGQAKVKVENKIKTAVLVGGLDELIIDADGEVTGEVTLTIENADMSSADVAAIQSAASGQTLEFMDISITKSENGVESAVSDTGDTAIEIVLPFDRTGKGNIAVYRCHDGNVDTLTMQVSGKGEKIEVDDDSIAIYAKKFSVYTIGYTVSTTDPDTPSTPTTPSRPSNSSSSSGGSSGSNYSITVPTRVTGGTVKVFPTSASAGAKVTITATPNNGYELDTLTVTDASGSQVSLTNQGNHQYAFTMPKSKVTVVATFKAVVPTTPVTPATIDFVDVPPSEYYADAVAWAVEKSITAGTSDTTFSPDIPCTRAQIVTFLWWATGSPKAAANCPFTDVPVDSYYYDAVLWAVEQGITSGTSATTFSPNATCTRAQAVTFLYRHEKSPVVSGSNAFTDVAADAYYSNAVQWAMDTNITVGTSDTTFSPNETCTRSQIVTFLYRHMA